MLFDSRAIAVLNRLNSAGYEAYLVGGCVRDSLRNVAIHDYDATTSALPEEILQVFPDTPVIETGIRHGTVTVVFQGLAVEVTTYRVDGEYADSRHPNQVTFTRNLREDLARRDFTVNALAWSEEAGVVDFFGGMDDLAQGILRCVGEPRTRFEEDGLRILRGLRFASVLQFSLEPATESALRLEKHRLTMVSAERIREELIKMLCGDGAFDVLSSFSDVLGVVLPELLPTVGFDQRNFHHVYPLYEHLIHTVKNVPPLPRLRLAALFHDLGKPATFSVDPQGVGHFYGHAQKSAEMAEEILERLRFSNAERREIIPLIRHHDAPIEPTATAVRRKLNKLGEDGFFDLISLMRADNLALNPEFHHRQKTYDELEAIAREILAEEPCFSLRHLAVKGNDLMALGYQGKEIGEILRVLLAAVMDDLVENRREDLLDYWKSRENK
ncbi:MAG: HD domain-containing protein [Clostridia bacterium]|nr:HD domain-containing protein [Clostridia bacterium]